MGTLRMDAATVRALAEGVLERSDRLDEIDWPTLAFDEMTGSSVEQAAARPLAKDRLADVVAHMRTWAATARASAAAIQQAETRHAGRLAAPR